MNNQQAKSDSPKLEAMPTTEDAMRNFVISVAQNLRDEKLLRMLYIRAKNLNRM